MWCNEVVGGGGFCRWSKGQVGWNFNLVVSFEGL